MAKDAFWFKHDSNASADPKMVALVAQWGMAGKGMFWTLIELLREQENYRYNIAQKFAYASLADVLKLKTDDCKKFIQDLIDEFELLKSDDQFIWSESLLRRMSEWDSKKLAASERGRKGAEATNSKKSAQAKDTSSTSDENSRLSDGVSEKISGYKRREDKKREEEIIEEEKRSECEAKNDTHSHTDFFENNFSESRENRELTEFEAFTERINTRYPSIASLQTQISEKDFAWLTERYPDRHLIDFILQAMQNDPKLYKNNTTAMHAFKKYLAAERDPKVKDAIAHCDEAWKRKQSLKKMKPVDAQTTPIENPREPISLKFPFGESFLKLWKEWKIYLTKKGKQYSSDHEEQAALNLVADYSKGIQKTAEEIILKSMSSGWMGLFRPPENKQVGRSRETDVDSILSKIAAMPD